MRGETRGRNRALPDAYLLATLQLPQDEAPFLLPFIVGGDRKSRSHGRIDVVHADRLNLVQQVLVHEIAQAAVVENLVGVVRLIQSQPQRKGPRSPALREHDPYGGND